MDARQALSSLTQMEKDVGALAARQPGHLLDQTPAVLMKALMEASIELIPDDHVMRAVIVSLLADTDLSEMRLQEAVVLVGQLKAAIPKPGPTVA